MNAYFIQFFVPYAFFERWYEHLNNPTLSPTHVSREEITEMHRAIVEQIQKRGLMYHAVGHGWTCETLGISGDTWKPAHYDLPEKTTSLLAEVNGKRELWDGVAMNTNLCYGNPEARSRITDAIAEYCAAHPEIDYLHFWLADGVNNHCECPLCRDTLPSDFYVMMLNELDAKMTEKGIDTKIVFLIYVDLLWEPKVQKIDCPDRFVLMFAPITRTYTVSLLPDQPFEGELEPYHRNKNIMPMNVAENVARLRQWQKIYEGDSFDFDYHFMWDHLKDMGYYEMARVLMEDMKNLRKIGLNGMMSCQNQRVFFPTALGMHAMAEGLWNSRADFESFAACYFERAYGKMGNEAHQYLKSVSQKYDPPYLRQEKALVSAEQVKNYEELSALVDAFEPTIRDMLDAQTDPVSRREWQILACHAQLTRRMANVYKACAQGDAAAVQNAWADAREYACSIESDVHERLDVFEFIFTNQSVIERRKVL